MNSKVFVINNIYGEIEIFSSLDELIFMGWGDHYPTVQEAIASEWKVGVTPLSNIKNIRKEVKYTANLGVIDHDYDWYTDLPVDKVLVCTDSFLTDLFHACEIFCQNYNLI